MFYDRLDHIAARIDMKLEGLVEGFGDSVLELPPLPMRPTVRLAPDRRRDLLNRLVSHLTLNPGMAAGHRRAWRAFDEEAFIPEVVVGYHDYPYGNIDQIEARGCA